MVCLYLAVYVFMYLCLFGLFDLVGLGWLGLGLVGLGWLGLGLVGWLVGWLVCLFVCLFGLFAHSLISTCLQS